MSISVTVITKNEEANIARCLASVRWADEIVVIDSGSADRTVEIARKYTPHVHVEAWHGFGPQKNLAVSRATGDWILSLDADEWVSDELREALRAAAQSGSPHDAWSMPRSSIFCGRVMRHSGWWPDFVPRLFRRGKAEFSGDLVHERLLVRGTTGMLKAPLMHESYRDLDQVIEKMNLYSKLAAQDMHARGRRSSVPGAVARGLWAFFRTYILRAGILDGREGYMVAVATAQSTYYRYLKLMYLAEAARGGDALR
jgi:glycosyltransferase involved in cell wall biosynthesis